MYVLPVLLAAPYWINRPISVDGAEGDMAVFHCEAGGIPEPANFWYINGELTSSMLLGYNVNIENRLGLKD